MAICLCFFFFFQAEDGIRDVAVTGVQTCALPIYDSTKMIPLGYQQAQGKRVFYQYCVWCHADSTPAGPSNRSNLTPVPALLDDGATLNAESDEYLGNIITLGASASGKSAMMRPYGRTLSPEEIRSVIAFTRAIAQPPYQPPGRPGKECRSRWSPYH